MRVGFALTVMLALLQPPAQTTQVAVRSILVLSLRTAADATRCSNATLEAEFFTAANSVAAYYAENSNHLISLSGTVSGPYTITITGDTSGVGVRVGGDRRTCARQTWADAADAAATAAGVNVSAYSYKAYIEPPETQTLCNFGGDAVLNGSRSWVRNDHCDSKHVIAYSLAENFGAPNASTLTDFWGDVSTSLGGYITPADHSLWNSMIHFNAPEKISMRWLSVANVQTVTASGTFRLAFLDGASTEVQSLKIKGANSTSAYYYVSYRRAVGFSSDLRAEYADKLSVTRWNGGDRTYLLANLADGQSFTDSSGLKITQTSHDAIHAHVAVSFDK